MPYRVFCADVPRGSLITMTSSSSASGARIAIFISCGFAVLIAGIALLTRGSALGYLFLALAVGLLLLNVLLTSSDRARTD